MKWMNIFLAFLLAVSCNETGKPLPSDADRLQPADSAGDPAAQAVPSSVASEYSYIVYKNEQPPGTYGFDIRKLGKTVVHQTHIPAVSGIQGFQSVQEAAKVAELMLSKIARNEFPPTILITELDSLAVKYKKQGEE